MSQDDDDLDAHLRGLAEWADRQAAPHLESTWDLSADGLTENGTPLPETAHPVYANIAESVRSYLGDDHRLALHVPMMRSLSTRSSDDGATYAGPDTQVLEVKRCAGAAPFVGDPFVTTAWYVWPVAIDKHGRHVAGPAELIWRTNT